MASGLIDGVRHSGPPLLRAWCLVRNLGGHRWDQVGMGRESLRSLFRITQDLRCRDCKLQVSGCSTAV
jgi:hypothetical protein